MLCGLILAGIASLQDRDSEEYRQTLIKKHNQVNEILAPYRFRPDWAENQLFDYLPLKIRNSVFRVTFNNQLSGSVDSVGAWLTAKYRLPEGEFDKEAIEATLSQTGMHARIDVLGDLQITEAVALVSTSSEKCVETLTSFASRAAAVARFGTFRGSGNAVPVSALTGAELPSIKSVENRVVRFISDEDLRLLIVMWQMTPGPGGGSGSGSSWPYQFEGTSLRLYRGSDENERNYSHPIDGLEAAFRFQLNGSDVDDAVMYLKARFASWRFASYKPASGDIRINARTKPFRFGSGVTLKALKEFLVESAKEAKMMEDELSVP